MQVNKTALNDIVERIWYGWWMLKEGRKKRTRSRRNSFPLSLFLFLLYVPYNLN